MTKQKRVNALVVLVTLVAFIGSDVVWLPASARAQMPSGFAQTGPSLSVAQPGALDGPSAPPGIGSPVFSAPAAPVAPAPLLGQTTSSQGLQTVQRSAVGAANPNCVNGGAVTTQVVETAPRAIPAQPGVQVATTGGITSGAGPATVRQVTTVREPVQPMAQPLSRIEAAFAELPPSFLQATLSTSQPGQGALLIGPAHVPAPPGQPGQGVLPTSVGQVSASSSQTALGALLTGQVPAPQGQPGQGVLPTGFGQPGQAGQGGPPTSGVAWVNDAMPTPLRQFGYWVFASDVSTFAPVDDIPVGPDYVLGPGDDLSINVWGPIDSTIVRTVDRNGRVVLPRVGDLRVWGLTFSQADRLIREQLAHYFRGFQTSVTMGRLRTVRVYVVGEVCQPGSYTLSSLATLTNALFAAGGPTKLGSLRDIRLLRNHHTVGTLDLYEFLLHGDRAHDFRLESGDTIFVPTIGAVAGISGEVKRPAIYEIRGEARVSDLIEVAGGITPQAYLKHVQLLRAQPSAERVDVDVDLSQYYLKGAEASNPPVNAGDLVLIHRSDPRVYNTVKVEGVVKYPGVYELKPMMRIGQLLAPDQLLPEAYPDRVEVARRRADLSVEVVPVNLRKAWAGDKDQDILLKPFDEITVRTELRAARTVTLTGQVVRPGVYTVAEGERLSSVLARAGGFTEKAYLKGAAFTRASLKKVQQEQLDQFLKLQEESMLAQASTTFIGDSTTDTQYRAQTLQARRQLLQALAARVALGRMVIHLAPPEELKGTRNDVVLLDGDTVDVPEPPSSVIVLGAVRNSTAVLYKDDANADYYVNRAGGFSKQADKKEIHIVKADGSAVAGFTNIRKVEPGDTIVVPPKEETKVNWLPTVSSVVTGLGGVLLSVAALSVLF